MCDRFQTLQTLQTLQSTNPENPANPTQILKVQTLHTPVYIYGVLACKV